MKNHVRVPSCVTIVVVSFSYYSVFSLLAIFSHLCGESTMEYGLIYTLCLAQICHHIHGSYEYDHRYELRDREDPIVVEIINRYCNDRPGELENR